MDSTTRENRTRSARRRKRAYVIRRIKRAASPSADPGPGPIPEWQIAVESREAGESRPLTLSPEERYRAIAEAAYYIAERRGFEAGDPAEDWREAEAQIDAWLLGMDRPDGSSDS